MDDGISTRGKALLQRAPSMLFTAFETVSANPYDEKANPDGIINLGIAENHLMNDLLLPKLNATSFTEDHCDPPAASGSAILKLGLSRLLRRSFGFAPDESTLFVGAGAAAVLEHLFMHLTDPGQGVLVPAPFYGMFEHDLVARAACKLVHVPTLAQSDWKPSIKQLESAVNKARKSGIDVRAMLITSPDNPSGAMYTREEWRELIRFARTAGLDLVADEIYTFSVIRAPEDAKDYGGTAKLPCQLSAAAVLNEDPSLADMRERVHIIYALSKDFCINGLRVGCIHTQNSLLGKMLASSCGMIAPSAHVQAAVGRMLVDDKWVDSYLVALQKRLLSRYTDVCARLNKAGITCYNSRGGTYVWLDLRPWMPIELTSGADTSMWKRLIDSAKVNIPPGSFFYSQSGGWFRIVTTGEERELKAGLKRLIATLATLPKRTDI